MSTIIIITTPPPTNPTPPKTNTAMTADEAERRHEGEVALETLRQALMAGASVKIVET